MSAPAKSAVFGRKRLTPEQELYVVRCIGGLSTRARKRLRKTLGPKTDLNRLLNLQRTLTRMVLKAVAQGQDGLLTTRKILASAFVFYEHLDRPDVALRRDLAVLIASKIASQTGKRRWTRFGLHALPKGFLLNMDVYKKAAKSSPNRPIARASPAPSLNTVLKPVRPAAENPASRPVKRHPADDPHADWRPIGEAAPDAWRVMRLLGPKLAGQSPQWLLNCPGLRMSHVERAWAGMQRKLRRGVFEDPMKALTAAALCYRDGSWR